MLSGYGTQRRSSEILLTFNNEGMEQHTIVYSWIVLPQTIKQFCRYAHSVLDYCYSSTCNVLSVEIATLVILPRLFAMTNMTESAA